MVTLGLSFIFCIIEPEAILKLALRYRLIGVNGARLAVKLAYGNDISPDWQLLLVEKPIREPFLTS